MAIKLTERARVKDLLGIARADNLEDSILVAMIEQTSEEVERLCRRQFAEIQRVTFHESLDMDGVDPTPQYIHLNAPVDDQQLFEIVWAMYDRHDKDGVTLVADDFRLDTEKGLVTIRSSSAITTQILPLGRLPWYQYSPNGFRVTYTGGFLVSIAPSGDPPDPLDDFDVVQVPNGLQQVVALKIKQDFTECGMCQPWTEEQRQWLYPWKKKDLLFA